MKRFAEALSVANDDDLEAIRKYVEWVKVRNMIYRYFYFSAHWIKPVKRFHWLK